VPAPITVTFLIIFGLYLVSGTKIENIWLTAIGDFAIL
jgi:hypothetical protein